MASLNLAITALLVSAVAVLGTNSLSRDQCTSTRYCPDGTKCCPDTLHCCPIGTYCCFGSLRCCRTSIESAMDTSVLTSDTHNALGEHEASAFDRTSAQSERLQELLRGTFPRNHVRADEFLNRRLDDNPVIVIYNN